MPDAKPHAEETDLVDDLLSPHEDQKWFRAAIDHLHPDAADPFAELCQGGRTLPPTSKDAVAGEELDVLQELTREANAVLCNQRYVGAHYVAAPPLEPQLETETSEDPFRAPTGHPANESLLDMLDGPARIDGLIGPLEPLDSYEIFADEPAPDVLHLFAGDIVQGRRTGITAPLTRREHHFISMDSAYRPAQAQSEESEHDA
ncbi:TagK domain-containing protein [Pandoraea sp. NPDC090278]|uniref:TagK domain-containing protein n=1 Tax=Pandoraea sp. NPDC090278 TaxID=3364391 RepID=UPI003839DCB7